MSWHSVLALFGIGPDGGRVISEMPPCHDKDVGILGSFWDTVCKSCPGRILVAKEKQPDFQAFLGNFYDMVCRPCPLCGGEVVCGYNVQAMSGMCPGRDRDAARFLGFSRQFFGTRAATRTQPDFQAFLGIVWRAKFGTHPGRDRCVA
ncbi:Phosphate transporter PHO1 homolog 3 [Olea europaea subsp. europaea]|uniref:Phosphate transporter PHO1 homolog 3 n=1 Tax=Olea europaea subsp. europaea TaxID=158383 RepID=A0A8S0QGH9_OLEEU|nr:Phosphate transporter PHO1 homolog 3 [Olea europaea subsp. europaea]